MKNWTHFWKQGVPATVAYIHDFFAQQFAVLQPVRDSDMLQLIRPAASLSSFCIFNSTVGQWT